MDPTRIIRTPCGALVLEGHQSSPVVDPLELYMDRSGPDAPEQPLPA